MYRLALFAGLTLSLSACAGIRPGKVILTENSKDRYVQLREGRAGYVLSTIGHAENRPDLKDLREVHGGLEFICTEIHGVDNPRIVIESKNKAHYQVVYKSGDRTALEVIAKPLDLLVTQETREIQALTIRVLPGGHRLKPATKGKQVKVEDVCCDVEGRWPLDGLTADELARFLETRYRRPVVNLTALEGRWLMLLSEKAGKLFPSTDERAQLDDLGLELRWEKVKIPVTVIKDNPKEVRSGVMQYQYDEFDLTPADGGTKYLHAILFGNGWEVRVRFRHVEVERAEPLYVPAADADRERVA